MDVLIAKQIELETTTVDALRAKLQSNALRSQKEAKARKDASSLPQGVRFTENLYKEVLTNLNDYLEAEKAKKRKSTFFVNIIVPSQRVYETLQENKYTKGKFSCPASLIAWTIASQVSGILICPTGQKKVTSISREVVRVIKGTYSLGFEVSNEEIAGVTQFIRTFLATSKMVYEDHLACKTVVVALCEEFMHLTTDPEVIHELVSNKIDKALAYKPMIAEPTPHKSLTDGSGGYYKVHSPLIKEANRHCNYKCDKKLVDLLNSFQATEWNIDADYLAWFNSFESDVTYFESADLLTAYNFFARDVNPWIRQATTTLFEIRKERAALKESDVKGREYLRQVCKVIEDDLADLNERKEAVLSKTGKMDALKATHTLAQEFAVHDKFFLPPHVDDRGRVYTYCSALDFQGNKLAKSLIGVAKKERLTDAGLRELKIALGTCFDGYDKLKNDARIAAVDAHMELLFNVVTNPCDDTLDALEALTDGDDIYVAMRLAYELFMHMTYPNYKTGVLSYIDACSSAIQIQALVQHDKKAAGLTNIMDCEGEKLSDAYKTVADSCQYLVEEMAKDTDEDLLGKLTAYMSLNQSNRLV